MDFINTFFQFFFVYEQVFIKYIHIYKYVLIKNIQTRIFQKNVYKHLFIMNTFVFKHIFIKILTNTYFIVCVCIYIYKVQ